jgi:beta-galactosidase GanA
MKELKVGDLVKTRDIRKSAGIIIKKLSETTYGKSIYQIVWQNNTQKESYEPHENLEKCDEKTRLSEKKRHSASSTKSPSTPE